jgi:hypothetical protein
MMADVESIKSPGSSPSRHKKEDPLVDVAATKTKFQVIEEGREGREGVVYSRKGVEGFGVVHACSVLEGGRAIDCLSQRTGVSTTTS